MTSPWRSRINSMRRLTDLAGEGPRIAMNASPRAPTPPIMMSHNSICAFASHSRRRPLLRRRSRTNLIGSARLGGLLLRLLRQHALQVVHQGLGAGCSLAFGRGPFLTRVAQDHARQSGERRSHLPACDFRERLAELGRLGGELGVVWEDDVHRTLDRLLEVLAADL